MEGVTSMSQASKTLSDPQLTKPVFGLFHPPHVLRATDKQQSREDLLYEGAHLRKGQARALAGPHPLPLEERVGDGTDHHVVLPARIGAALEVVESQAGFEILVVLFDRPALMRQPHDLLERRRGWQGHEVVFATAGRSDAVLAEQPDFRRQSSVAPIGRWSDAPRDEVGFPGRIG